MMPIGKRVIFGLMALLLLIIFMFSGCGSKPKNEPAPTSDTSVDDKNQPAEGTKSNFNPMGFPIVNEPMTQRFMIRKPPHIGDPETMVVFQEYEKMTNVKVQWEAVNSDGFSERVNLVMASNDMPDAIMKGVPDITRCSADGSIIDLTELIEKYAPGISKLYEEKPETKIGSLSPDGKIYAIPAVNTLTPNLTGHRNLWINKSWLDKLGLEVPKTMDEFVEVLKAFRDGDPNENGKQDEIPLVLEYGGGNHTARTDQLSGSWGLYPNMGYRLMINDGKVEIYLTSDKWREVLEFYHLLWEEKLLDNTIYSQTADVALSKFNSEISGVFGLSSDDLWSRYSDHYIPLPPPKNTNGDPQVIGLDSSYGGSAMVITRTNQNPEIAVRWIDYFYTEEGSMFIGCFAPSLEGKTCKKLPDGSYDYTDAMHEDPRGISVTVGEVCPLPGGGFPYWRNENNSNYIYSDTVKKAVPIYEPYYQKKSAYPYPVFSLEDVEKVNDIRRDLDTYINECEAKFITGEMGFDRWQEYVETCEKMGINELESYFQKAYDSLVK